MKALVGAFNQEKALVGAFSVIVQPLVEPMEQTQHLTQESSEVIRDLERELNISSGQLALSTTLHKLLLLTDVVLEASSSDSSKEGEKFMKSQVFLDSVRGRMRRLPLMFNSAQQMFQQR